MSTGHNPPAHMNAEIPISPLNFPYAAALSIFQAKGQFLMPSSRIKSKHGGKRDRGLSISGILYTLRVFTFRHTPTRYISQQQLNNTFFYIYSCLLQQNPPIEWRNQVMEILQRIEDMILMRNTLK